MFQKLWSMLIIFFVLMSSGAFVYAYSDEIDPTTLFVDISEWAIWEVFRAYQANLNLISRNETDAYKRLDISVQNMVY